MSPRMRPPRFREPEVPPRTGVPDACPLFTAKNVLVRRRRDVTRAVDTLPGARGVPVGQGKSYVSRRPSAPIGWWACITARRCKAGAALAIAAAASGDTAARLAATTCASCKIGQPCSGAGAPRHPRPLALAAGLAAEAGENAVRGPAQLLRGRGPATHELPVPRASPACRPRSPQRSPRLTLLQPRL